MPPDQEPFTYRLDDDDAPTLIVPPHQASTLPAFTRHTPPAVQRRPPPVAVARLARYEVERAQRVETSRRTRSRHVAVALILIALGAAIATLSVMTIRDVAAVRTKTVR